ncbi:MAG: branched-chain amino acid permease (azaleucine resistance) [Rhizobiales bacterium 62-47]|nr:AzlC family ABC transporter permease [Hyphomicrobiales bacterium]OJY10423.1 MAG: branched-chain amino acid permease (azaleucine resistance) [Rhizobiales bacterium 62-47]
MVLPALDSPGWRHTTTTFLLGVRAVGSTILTLVLFATYLGIGALAHDSNFSMGWALAGTLFVWAGPAQIILISTLGTGGTAVQAAIAVTLSAIRLFPMVVAVLPMIRTPQTPLRKLVLPAHFIAVTMWIECSRMLPAVPREQRLAFANGLGVGLVSVCLVATAAGYVLSANLPELLAAGILLLTPLAFLFSTARNSRQLVDRLALLLGLALFPIMSMLHTGVDILLSGLTAGTLAYGVHWWREQR